MQIWQQISPVDDQEQPKKLKLAPCFLVRDRGNQTLIKEEKQEAATKCRGTTPDLQPFFELLEVKCGA